MNKLETLKKSYRKAEKKTKKALDTWQSDSTNSELFEAYTKNLIIEAGLLENIINETREEDIRVITANFNKRRKALDAIMDRLNKAIMNYNSAIPSNAQIEKLDTVSLEKKQ